MTVVLPAPVASLSARRSRPGFACSLAAARWSRKRAALVAETRRDLGQPDRGLRRLDLAEEGPGVAEAVSPPVLQEPGRLGRHPPPAGVRYRTPRIDPAPQLVDDLHQLVLLPLRLQGLRRLVEDHLALAALLRLRDRRDERHAPAAVEDAARGLAALVELPVPRRVLVGRVEDGAIEEPVAHGGVSLSRGWHRGIHEVTLLALRTRMYQMSNFRIRRAARTPH